MTTSENYLAHYGVKGMKWGVRHKQKVKARKAKKAYEREVMDYASKNYDKNLIKSSNKLSRSNPKKFGGHTMVPIGFDGFYDYYNVLPVNDKGYKIATINAKMQTGRQVTEKYGQKGYNTYKEKSEKYERRERQVQALATGAIGAIGIGSLAMGGYLAYDYKHGR